MVDAAQIGRLLHGKENPVSTDAAYVDVGEYPKHVGQKIAWRIKSWRSGYHKHGRHSVLYRLKRPRVEQSFGGQAPVRLHQGVG